MSVLPIAFSLMATFLSTTTFMGVPTEIYLYGTNLVFMNLGFIIGPIIASYIFLPIFFANDVSTAYEYLEKRFGKTVRRSISAMFAIQWLLFTAASLSAPTLALSAVTNLSIEMSVIVIGVLYAHFNAPCTDNPVLNDASLEELSQRNVVQLCFQTKHNSAYPVTVAKYACVDGSYPDTSVEPQQHAGGMKAVLWADVFQAVLMFAALFAVIIKGFLLLGGIGNIFEIANEGGRLIIPK
ncbi:putative sodium-dependent multivitamin transporter [Trichonephila inaurata madagascariensis]|uniref:Putative sodium-dependent multivitamin transporter n=1 Tax=Trichonephila inaurata madagascariensis TaxID=2747483 RepID=A0A8X6XY58_9ARAC|nr:putative sodium-dependent multivitamin transporter [Trichonephila inaurata madagascariensis]